jgi:ElaB/YqjD/DUF883 family membrane-anchored ribosome-binding protein
MTTHSITPYSSDDSVTPKQSRDDFDKPADTVAGFVASSAAALRDNVSSMGESISSTASGMADTAAQFAGDTQDMAVSMSRDFEKTIERNPLTAALVAAGVGMVLGMITLR